RDSNGQFMVEKQIAHETKPPIATPTKQVTYGELFRFYIPLAIQAASQSLTYPLVASIASHGKGGPLNLAGMAQAMTLMGLLGMLGAGLVTTGMVYGKTKAGFARFQQVNWLFTVIVVVLMAILSIPPLAHLCLRDMLGLPVSIEKPAYQAFVASLALQVLFFIRNPYQVVLYIYGATTKASVATISRIIGTVALVPVFVYWGLIGPIWAVVAQSVAVGFEVLLSWYFARPYTRLLPHTGVPPNRKEMVTFTLPLSAGGFFLNVSNVVISWSIGHAPNPERMMEAYYLASGLAGPAAFAASRVQTVVLSILPRVKTERMLRTFTLIVGLLMGGVPLLFILPGMSNIYYVSVQRCPKDLMPLVCISAIGLLFHPLTMAIRGYLEGKAAYQKKPIAILTGHSAYFVILTGTALGCIALGISGNLLPALSLLLANLAAAITMQIGIAYKKRRQPHPVPSETVES
ncbi:MAG TPA: hypothetical protein VHV83_16025, partial [Armatimonadota bacterium]|nr:hypothetical protein [Armatimonadota bacterium]